MLYNSFRTSVKAAEISSQTIIVFTEISKRQWTISSIPWVIPCNINTRSILLLDGSSGNFCLKCLTPEENKDTLPSQNTKLNSAVNCISFDFLLLIAPYLTHCTGLRKEGAVALAQISARHTSNYSPKCFHLPELLGLRDPQEHGISPQLPKNWNSGDSSLP